MIKRRSGITWSPGLNTSGLEIASIWSETFTANHLHFSQRNSCNLHNESGDSSGEVSLCDLFKGEIAPRKVRSVELPEIAYLICRGRWPQTIDMSHRDVHLDNGEYGLVEVKLGGGALIDSGAKTLVALSNQIDTTKMKPPAFKMVLTAVGEYAYRRPADDVIVCPITSLQP